MAESSSNTDVFLYTEGMVVPDDVVRVRVHPSVTVIPDEAFHERKKLEEVELCEGLVEIGRDAFKECWKLSRITIPSFVCKIPSTVTRIGDGAFSGCDNLEAIDLSSCEALLEIGRDTLFECTWLANVTMPTNVTRVGEWSFGWIIKMKSMNLPNNIERIGDHAFYGCTELLALRIPPLVTTISEGMMGQCGSVFSIELCDATTSIEQEGFRFCHLLRNIAIPQNVWVGYRAFESCTDLQHVLGLDRKIINPLKQRFDNLPIHKMIYYQSYQPVTMDQLNNALDMRSGQRRSSRKKLDQTGKQQDCLGMTPLHIMACSTVQNIELYRVLIEKYPETLVTEDRWGDVPLLYAVLGNAPDEIVQFLVESYTTMYPNHVLNWTDMMWTLGRASVEYKVIRKLSEMQEASFPKQSIDWNKILEKAVSRWDFNLHDFINKVEFKRLVRRSLAARVKAIGLKHYWRKISQKMFETDVPEGSQGRRDYIAEVQAHLVHCENEYHTLKEATTLLELVLWKKKMDDHCQERNDKRRIKRVKIDESYVRQQCRVGSGADIVIGNVMQYLVAMEDGD